MGRKLRKLRFQRLKSLKLKVSRTNLNETNLWSTFCRLKRNSKNIPATFFLRLMHPRFSVLSIESQGWDRSGNKIVWDCADSFMLSCCRSSTCGLQNQVSVVLPTAWFCYIFMSPYHKFLSIIVSKQRLKHRTFSNVLERFGFYKQTFASSLFASRHRVKSRMQSKTPSMLATATLTVLMFTKTRTKLVLLCARNFLRASLRGKHFHFDSNFRGFSLLAAFIIKRMIQGLETSGCEAFFRTFLWDSKALFKF